MSDILVCNNRKSGLESALTGAFLPGVNILCLMSVDPVTMFTTGGLPIVACGLASLTALPPYLDASYRISSVDDHRLLTKLDMEDCGGISKMSKNVEGCFRKYVGDAICRQTSSPNYSALEHRFSECFANRPELSCGDWFTRTDVFR